MQNIIDLNKLLLYQFLFLFIETPTPPKKLQVTGASFSWIHFTWTQSPMDTNITKYIILVSREDEQRNVTKEDTQTNANITDLEPGTEYTFRVVAIAIDGQSSIPSDLLTVSTSQTGITNYLLHRYLAFISSQSFL